MVKVEAIIRASRIDVVRAALSEAGARGVTITDSWGSGRQRGYAPSYASKVYSIDLQRNVRVETVVRDGEAAGVVDAVRKAAQTGEIGDGKIFVTPILDAIRIRTEERGEAAIC